MSIKQQIDVLAKKRNSLEASIAAGVQRLEDLEKGINAPDKVSDWLRVKGETAASVDVDRQALSVTTAELAALEVAYAAEKERAHLEALEASVVPAAMACLSRLNAHLAEAKGDLDELASLFDRCEKEIRDRGGPTDPRARPIVLLMEKLPGASGPSLPIAARFLAS